MGESEVALRQENFIQANEIRRLNVQICEHVEVNKRFEDQVKRLMKSLDAAKKKMKAEKVAETLELSSTKVELELAKRQVLSSNMSKAFRMNFQHFYKIVGSSIG